MKHLTILVASSLLFACGSGDSGDSSEGQATDPINEKADALHDAMDRAQEVEAILEEQKQSIDDALEEAEASSPD